MADQQQGNQASTPTPTPTPTPRQENKSNVANWGGGLLIVAALFLMLLQIPDWVKITIAIVALVVWGLARKVEVAPFKITLPHIELKPFAIIKFIAGIGGLVIAAILLYQGIPWVGQQVSDFWTKFPKLETITSGDILKTMILLIIVIGILSGIVIAVTKGAIAKTPVKIFLLLLVIGVPALILYLVAQATDIPWYIVGWVWYAVGVTVVLVMARSNAELFKFALKFSAFVGVVLGGATALAVVNISMPVSFDDLLRTMKRVVEYGSKNPWQALFGVGLFVLGIWGIRAIVELFVGPRGSASSMSTASTATPARPGGGGRFGLVLFVLILAGLGIWAWQEGLFDQVRLTQKLQNWQADTERTLQNLNNASDYPDWQPSDAPDPNCFSNGLDPKAETYFQPNDRVRIRWKSPYQDADGIPVKLFIKLGAGTDMRINPYRVKAIDHDDTFLIPNRFRGLCAGGATCYPLFAFQHCEVMDKIVLLEYAVNGVSRLK